MNRFPRFETGREIAERSLRAQLAKAEARATMTAQFSDFLMVITLRQELVQISGGAR